MPSKKHASPVNGPEYGPPCPVTVDQPSLPDFEESTTEVYGPVTLSSAGESDTRVQYHRVETTERETRTVIGNAPDDPNLRFVMSDSRDVRNYHHTVFQERKRKTHRERPLLACPKDDVKRVEKSRLDKTAPIKRFNTPSPDDVPCPECSTGVQPKATCTICDGTGRRTTEQVADYWDAVRRIRDVDLESATA